MSIFLVDKKGYYEVGIFDSGIGGLTVLDSLSDRYRFNDYIYYGDRLNMPYGNKNIDELFNLSCDIIDFLISEGANVIVIACGTVSSCCYQMLIERYKNIKIIDIISPTINYVNNLDIDSIGVIATVNTISSHVFKNNIYNKRVYEVAIPYLAEKIENNDRVVDIDNFISKINSSYVILGCTHYPVISNLIDKKTINLADNIILEENVGNSSIKLYFSKIDSNLINNVARILKDKKYFISLKDL